MTAQTMPIPEKSKIDIVTTPSNDNRSYHVNSDKILRVLGFRPRRTIEDAVRDIARKRLENARAMVARLEEELREDEIL